MPPIRKVLRRRFRGPLRPRQVNSGYEDDRKQTQTRKAKPSRGDAWGRPRTLRRYETIGLLTPIKPNCRLVLYRQEDVESIQSGQVQTARSRRADAPMPRSCGGTFASTRPNERSHGVSTSDNNHAVICPSDGSEDHKPASLFARASPQTKVPEQHLVANVRQQK